MSANTVYSGSAVDGAVEVLELPSGTSESQAAGVADSLTGVVAAESNSVYRIRAAESLANDPFYLNGGLWGMYGANTSPSSRYGSNAAAAWGAGFTGSRNVYVAVIDSGTQITHPDLAANVWTNPYDPLDGVDNDGNGFVD
ncbi:MAG: peptidase S8, partial [Actinomycetota bacterium]|nr:peptidase S8 [Actinomycetota bacterium]